MVRGATLAERLAGGRILAVDALIFELEIAFARCQFVEFARGQAARWSLSLPSEPRAWLAAWHGLVEPLLDALEGVGRERAVDPPTCRISPPVDADQIGQLWPAALAWRVGAGGSMRARAQILHGEQWSDLSGMNALIEILDIDRGRAIWCEQLP